MTFKKGIDGLSTNVKNSERSTKPNQAKKSGDGVNVTTPLVLTLHDPGAVTSGRVWMSQHH